MIERTSSSLPSDNGVPALCPVPWADAISKAVVRAADPAAWWPLWRALQAGIDGAKDAARTTGTALPWETSEEITDIAWPDFQRALEDAIGGTIPGIPERRRLVAAASKVYDELVAKGTGKPLRQTRFGIKTCSRAGCGARFAARSHRHIYCSTACRTGAYEARQRANGQGQENVRESAG